jgi:CHASE3 domain sensor protein
MLLGEVAACVGAVAAAGATAVSYLNRKKIQQVHVLVNSQLSDVIRKLDGATAKIVVLESAARRSVLTQTPVEPVASVLPPQPEV